MIQYLLLFLCFTSTVYGTQDFNENLLEKKVRAHILIGDYQSALKILSHAPFRSKKILELEIESYAALLDEGSLIACLKAYQAEYPQENDLAIYETVSWSIIKKACKSSSIPTRYEGLLAAFLAQSAKGVDLLYNGFSDSSHTLRNFCTHLAKYQRDDHILEKVYEIFHTDPSFETKLLAIQALGCARLEKAKDEVFSLLEKELTREEKENAILAYVEMKSDVTSSIIEKIYKSPHAALRTLSLELILSRLKKDCIPYVLELALDPNLDVKIQSLQTLGILVENDNVEAKKIVENLKTSDEAFVAITSLWFLLRNSSTYDETFTKWLTSENQKNRLYAVSALGHAGDGALFALKNEALFSKDPYVRVNAALALLRFQKEKDLVKKSIINFLDTVHERIGTQEFGIFSAIGPTIQSHDLVQPQIPETEDLMTRLGLIGALSECDVGLAQEKMLGMLSEKTWGISANAMALLLQEGPLSSINLIKPLLYDKSSTLSLQAALFLSSTTQDKDALEVLLKHYNQSPIETKEMILFALGQMHCPEAIGFLRQVLVDRSQILRIKAASAILQCINN